MISQHVLHSFLRHLNLPIIHQLLARAYGSGTYFPVFWFISWCLILINFSFDQFMFILNIFGNTRRKVFFFFR
jgi:hypothetical protein